MKHPPGSWVRAAFSSTVEVVIVSEKQTGARFLAETFKGYGVTHVFFVEAILRKTMVELETVGIRRILTHSEKAAAYMADGYARATQKPGICMAQSVGAANLASGLQDPYLGSSPVIAITGKKAPLWQNRNSYQEVDHTPLFAPVTKYNVTVDTAEQLPLYVRQAFREATSGRPRPVHLDIAGGYMGAGIESAEGNFAVIVEEKFIHTPAFRPEPESDAVGKAVELLRTAERPVIVAGGGARISGARPEIVELAERLSIPMATSLDGKDAVPDTHPLNVGIVGSYSRWCANRLVSEADLVLYIGSGTGDQVTNDWTIPRPGTAVIQIDIDPAELGRSYPNAVSLLGDAKVTLGRMIALIGEKRKNPKWNARAQQLLGDWQKEMEPFCRSAATPIRTERLCQEISDAFPESGILVSDTGFASIWTGGHGLFQPPGPELHQGGGFAGLGLPGGAGRQMRRSRATGRLLHRRWRILLPPDRARNCQPLRDQRRDRGQQQPAPQAVHGRDRPGLRRSARKPRRAVQILENRFRQARRGYGVCRNPGGKPRGDRPGLQEGALPEQTGGGRRGHRSRLPGAGSLDATGQMMRCRGRCRFWVIVILGPRWMMSTDRRRCDRVRGERKENFQK